MVLDARQDANFVECILLLLVREFDHLDLFESVYFFVGQSLDLVD